MIYSDASQTVESAGAKPTAEEMARVDAEVAQIRPEDLEYQSDKSFQEANSYRRLLEAPELSSSSGSHDLGSDSVQDYERKIAIEKYRQDAIASRLAEIRKPARTPDTGLAQFDQGRMNVVDDTTPAPADDIPLITPENQQMAESDVPAPIEKSGDDELQTPEGRAIVDGARKDFAEAVAKVDEEIAKQKERAKVLLAQSIERVKDLDKWKEEELSQQKRLRAIIGEEEVETGKEEW